MRNRGWCRSSASDSSVSENWGEEEVKSGIREGERERWVPSSEELRGLRSPARCNWKDGVSGFEPVRIILSVARWLIPALERRRRPRCWNFSAVDCLRMALSRRLTCESLKCTRSRASRIDLSMACSTAVRRWMRSSSGQVAFSPFSIASTMNCGVGLLRIAKLKLVSGKIVMSPV